MNLFPIVADVWSFIGGFGATILVLIALGSIFWIWAIVDCATNSRLASVQKIVWLLVVIFLHFPGALVYAVAGRNSKGWKLS